MFNQVNLTGIVKSCQNVSFEGKPVSVLAVELFGNSSFVRMLSFKEIIAETGDIISVKGSLDDWNFNVHGEFLVKENHRDKGSLRVVIDDYQVQSRLGVKKNAIVEVIYYGGVQLDDGHRYNIAKEINAKIKEGDKVNISYTCDGRNRWIDAISKVVEGSTKEHWFSESQSMDNSQQPLNSNKELQNSQASNEQQDNLRVINGAAVEALNGYKVKLAGYSHEFGTSKWTKNKEFLKVGAFLKFVIYTQPKTGKMYINEIHEYQCRKTA